MSFFHEMTDRRDLLHGMTDRRDLLHGIIDRRDLFHVMTDRRDLLHMMTNRRNLLHMMKDRQDLLHVMIDRLDLLHGMMDWRDLLFVMADQRDLLHVMMNWWDLEVDDEHIIYDLKENICHKINFIDHDHWWCITLGNFKLSGVSYFPCWWKKVSQFMEMTVHAVAIIPTDIVNTFNSVQTISFH